MKKIYAVLFSAVFTASLAWGQTIPNGGFEDWSNSEPTGWSTLDQVSSTFGLETCIQGTSGAPEGASFLELVTGSNLLLGTMPGLAVTGSLDFLNGTGYPGFPCTSRPAYLNGKFQWDGTDMGDTAFVYVGLTKWNTTTLTQDSIAYGQLMFTQNTSGWTALSIQMMYYSTADPDTCIIAMISGDNQTTPGATLFADKLEFSNTTAVQEAAVNELPLYPNPTSFSVQVDLSAMDEVGVIHIQVVDMVGKVVMTESTTSRNLFRLNTESLPSGIYLVQVSQPNKVMTSRLTKK